MILIPSIDLRGGRCVRLERGDFAAETRYDVEPLSLARKYAALGADWLHVVDLDGARDGTLAHRETLVALSHLGAPRLQVGGGIRSLAMAAELIDAGVGRVVIGSAAIERPDETLAALERFEAERVCLAFDVRIDADGTPRVQTRAWTESTVVTLWDAVARYAPAGLAHVLCTDVDRDGLMGGPNLALYGEAVVRFPRIGWQASGGVRNAEDLAALAKTGVAAAISGRALLEGRITNEELRPFLPAA